MGRLKTANSCRKSKRKRRGIDLLTARFVDNSNNTTQNSDWSHVFLGRCSKQACGFSPSASNCKAVLGNGPFPISNWDFALWK
jgi:hypothetical protein